MAGAVLVIVAMALLFPPLVFAGGLVLSALFGELFSLERGDEPPADQPAG